MKNAILVPGRPDKDQHYDPNRPSNSEDFWFSWLKRKLILKDIHTSVVEPPFPFRPRYDEWRKEFERFDITPNTILIGHSCGGGFLVRWLSENKDITVGKVILVAPWTNPLNYKVSDTADFFEFKVDSDFPSRTKETIVFISNDDEPSVVETVDILKESVQGINYREYSDRKHFTTKEFPELLKEIMT